MVLSATVVPWITASMRAQKSPTLESKRSASCAKPVITPTDWSCGVDGVLSSTTAPVGVTQMRSVKVPPTSIPTR